MAGELPATPRRIAAFMVMVVGMFMAILDIQIVASSLAELQAGLSASADEIGWVQTAYLIAEVVMIPLSGILARILSTRVFFSISAAGFVVTSGLCALASSLDQMMLWRALQGFIGGGMIPSVFSAAYLLFPPRRQGMVSAVVGLVATLAPTLGPILGGWLTETFSWHWLFLINLPIGLAVALAAWVLIDFDRPEPELVERFDWWGLAGMAAFLGALQYVLEEGPRNDWLADPTIRRVALLSALGAVVFFWRAFTAPQPVVELRGFRNFNFAAGSALSFVMGIGLYGLTYLYPVYLASIRGMNSLQIGETMFVSGLAMLASAPIAGLLAGRVDPRAMLTVGLALFGLSSWQLTHLTAEWDFHELLLPQILRGLSLMLCMVPINNLALGTLPAAELKNASGLYNLMRNLGGAVGLAIIATLLDKRGDLHQARLLEALTPRNIPAQEALQALAGRMASQGVADPTAAAEAAFARLIGREAAVMAFIDVFFLIAVLYLAAALVAPLLRRPEGEAPAPAH